MNTPDIVTANKKPDLRRSIRLSVLILFVLLLVLGGIKGWRVYQMGISLYREVNALRGLAGTPVGDMDFEAVASELTDLQDSLDEFKQEAKPFLWLAPALGWVPVHGGDIANAPAFLDLASHIVNVSLTSLQAAGPLLDEMNSPESDLDPAGLTRLLVDAQPQLLAARDEFDRGLAVRDLIQTDRLSPRLKGLVVDDLDPLLSLLDDGFSLATTLPVVLGADGHGPKSYLLLVQNEDELRPTGGFITTVGRLVVQNGRVISLDFEGVDNEADWSRPFPAAPWQLQEYMNAPVMILRDSNWFPDFRTSAMWAEYLYSYQHAGPLDGVIAFDQQFIVLLLRVLGPLDVDGVSYAITSENVIPYMRSAKEPPRDGPVPVDWYRKAFIEELSKLILQKLTTGRDHDWRGLAATVRQSLDERHLLLQFDNPAVASLLAEHDWDNAVRPPDGDFLMVTDTNIGFNKADAVVDVSLSYDVDLTDISAGIGSLLVTHRNHAGEDVPCLQWGYRPVEGAKSYPMDRCYWTYLRVYKQSDVELLASTPHSIPGEWMLTGRGVPARVDILEEGLDNVQGFGTLLVVPGGEALNTGFEFALPASVISHDIGNGLYTYCLKVQKQPGTFANPMVIRVHLPDRSEVVAVNMDSLVQGENVLLETDLRTDVYLELVFHVK